MSQNLIAKLEHIDTSAAQTRWFLKKFEDQQTYFDQRLERLSREIAAAKVLILILAIALSGASVAVAILIACAA
jgi:hypothetical protein